MLFRDFFPRLQDRALRRYGEALTERQFKDWRENELLPGPQKPIGQGRGRSPTRQWTTTSYRRALRICRYKSWGARRKSQWMLGFWLSGEYIQFASIRDALRREFSVYQRGHRSFIDSNRWRYKRFTTIDDIVPSTSPDRQMLEDLLNLTGLEPDQFRAFANTQLGETSISDNANLLRELIPGVLGIDSYTTNQILNDFSPEQISRLWAPGHMSQGAERAGEFIDSLSSDDIMQIPRLLFLRKEAAALPQRVEHILDGLGIETPEIFAIGRTLFEARQIQHRIYQALEIASELVRDRESGRPPNWRRGGAVQNANETISNIAEFLKHR